MPNQGFKFLVVNKLSLCLTTKTATVTSSYCRSSARKRDAAVKFTEANKLMLQVMGASIMSLKAALSKLQAICKNASTIFRIEQISKSYVRRQACSSKKSSQQLSRSRDRFTPA